MKVRSWSKPHTFQSSLRVRVCVYVYVQVRALSPGFWPCFSVVPRLLVESIGKQTFNLNFFDIFDTKGSVFVASHILY